MRWIKVERFKLGDCSDKFLSVPQCEVSSTNKNPVFKPNTGFLFCICPVTEKLVMVANTYQLIELL